MLTLSRAEAALVAQMAQGLFDPPNRNPTPEDVAAMVDRLGLVQVDTISVIARSQYLVLWSRLGAYARTDFDRLLHPTRQTFEYWGHAASIIPMHDYVHFRRRMLDYQRHMYVGTQRWVTSNRAVLDATLDRLRRDGAMASINFERDETKTRAGRWDWYGPKESRRALEALWTMGEVMVHSRRAGQKVYDLRERVLTEALGQIPDDGALPDSPETRRYFARRTLSALGLILPSWLHDYYRIGVDSIPRKREAEGWLADLVASSDATPVRIDGIPGVAAIDNARLGDLDRIRRGERPTHATLLSPFDSLIWDRSRARALFDYEVVFEAYVVPERRVYGYYCLAILYRGAIVGRVDLKMDRAEGALIVRGLWLESGANPDGEFPDALAAALSDLAGFLGGRRVDVALGPEVAFADALSDRLA